MATEGVVVAMEEAVVMVEVEVDTAGEAVTTGGTATPTEGTTAIMILVIFLSLIMKILFLKYCHDSSF